MPWTLLLVHSQHIRGKQTRVRQPEFGYGNLDYFAGPNVFLICYFSAYQFGFLTS